jgi:hypothetical protein
MADDLNNKKNIDDSARSLSDFNSALRESIDLSKQLAKAVGSLSPSLDLNESLNKKLVKGANEYNIALSDTLKLSAKVAKGKVKEQEVQDQINTLQEKYTKFITNNNSILSNRGKTLKAQKDLAKEIAALEEKEIKRRNDIAAADSRIDQLNEQIAQHTRTANAARGQTRDHALNQIRLAKAQRKEEEQTIKLQESFSKNSDRIIAQKQKEKEKIDTTINAYKEIKKAYEDQIKNAEILAEANRKNSAWYKLTKGDLKEQSQAFKEILGFLGGIGAAFKPILDFAFKVSNQANQLQKNLVLSQGEAYALRQDFNDMAVASGDVAVNTQRLVEANLALGKQLGFNSKFTTDLNVQFVKLTKQLGLSEEAAGGLAKLSIATGATLEDSKNIAYETTQRLSSQYGIQLNQREVLEEIGKLSGQTLAMFKANPKALAEAVAQAKLLGTTLDQTKKQASSLLNFETSIENELQAELLTGQQLNLERARTAALMGDQTTVMKELANQNIDFNKYSNMNVIAQDKVAAALGLSSDELSNQLLKQQYLGKSREEIAALAGEEVANRVEAINAQDKFNLAVEKMQDLIGTIAAGPLGTFVDMIASAAENAGVLFTIMGGLATLSLTKLVTGLAASAVQAGLLAVGTAATASAITLGVGTLAIVAGIVAMSAAYENAKAEAAQPAGDMFSSSGKTMVSTKEGGLFSLSDNDEFAAAPGLGDMINRPGQTVVTQDNSALIEELRALKAEMAGTKEGINRLNNKEGIVKINGQTAGTAQMMGNYNLA